MLNRFRNESWAADHLDMMYPDEARLAWAKATGYHGRIQHFQLNGYSGPYSFRAARKFAKCTITHELEDDPIVVRYLLL